jgi:hypothetical protein
MSPVGPAFSPAPWPAPTSCLPSNPSNCPYKSPSLLHNVVKQKETLSNKKNHLTLCPMISCRRLLLKLVVVVSLVLSAGRISEMGRSRMLVTGN